MIANKRGTLEYYIIDNNYQLIKLPRRSNNKELENMCYAQYKSIVYAFGGYGRNITGRKSYAYNIITNT